MRNIRSHKKLDLTRMLHYGCTMYNRTSKSILRASPFLIALLLGSCSLHSCSREKLFPRSNRYPGHFAPARGKRILSTSRHNACGGRQRTDVHR